MPLRIAAVAPALLSTLLLPSFALARAPADASPPPDMGEVAIEVAPAPEAAPSSEAASAPEAAPQPEAAALESAEAPVLDEEPSAAELELVRALVAAELAAQELEQAEEYEEYEAYEEDENWEDSYEPKRTVLELQSGYIGLGIAPGMTIHDDGFHPNTRFELEFGGTLEHEFRDLGLSFGVVSHLTPYYGRKQPSFGADVTSTIMLGPIYLRTGLGALGGLPRNHRVENTAAAIGGVVGAGLNFGRSPMLRVGVDYDFRVTTRLEPVHTVFLAVRFACCRED